MEVRRSASKIRYASLCSPEPAQVSIRQRIMIISGVRIGWYPRRRSKAHEPEEAVEHSPRLRVVRLVLSQSRVRPQQFASRYEGISACANKSVRRAVCVCVRVCVWHARSVLEVALDRCVTQDGRGILALTPAEVRDSQNSTPSSCSGSNSAVICTAKRCQTQTRHVRHNMSDTDAECPNTDTQWRGPEGLGQRS
eukprot:1386080-Rhodomonas_salina.1